MRKVSIVGTVGIPASYGGFETLAENLAAYCQEHGEDYLVTVYCSGLEYSEKRAVWRGANLVYVPLKANGVQSVIYDIFCIVASMVRRADVILVLGVSGALVFPLARLLSKAKIVVNVDGIEWQRAKWGFFGRTFLRFSEYLAVRFSSVVVADNGGVADYLFSQYGVKAETIAYGGDHALDPGVNTGLGLPEIEFSSYAFALCRIEPENNVHLILSAVSKVSDCNLIFVGNWNGSEYGRKLRDQFSGFANILLLDPIYDQRTLFNLRRSASVYLHGHSAGGTNPSLVEMMHFCIPVIAYDCVFNRETTDARAFYFQTDLHLRGLLLDLDAVISSDVGQQMKLVADSRYCWDMVGGSYFSLFRAD